MTLSELCIRRPTMTVLLSLSLLALIRKRADWRAKLAEAEAGEAAQ